MSRRATGAPSSSIRDGANDKIASRSGIGERDDDDHVVRSGASHPARPVAGSPCGRSGEPAQRTGRPGAFYLSVMGGALPMWLVSVVWFRMKVAALARDSRMPPLSPSMRVATFCVRGPVGQDPHDTGKPAPEPSSIERPTWPPHPVAVHARLRQVTAPLPTPLTRSSESPGPSPSVAPGARYRWIPFRCSPPAGKEVRTWHSSSGSGCWWSHSWWGALCPDATGAPPVCNISATPASLLRSHSPSPGGRSGRLLRHPR